MPSAWSFRQRHLLFLKKLGIKLPYDPTIYLLGIYPEKTVIERDTFIPMFITALFTVARTCSNLDVHGQMNGIQKLWHMYTTEAVIQP